MAPKRDLSTQPMMSPSGVTHPPGTVIAGGIPVEWPPRPEEPEEGQVFESAVLPNLKEFKGSLWDGSAKDFEMWQKEIKTALGAAGVVGVLKDHTFYGESKEGNIVLGAHPDKIKFGTDLQSRVASWLQSTLQPGSVADATWSTMVSNIDVHTD